MSVVRRLTSNSSVHPEKLECDSLRRWASGLRVCRSRWPSRGAARLSRAVGLIPARGRLLVPTIGFASWAKKSNTGVDATLYAATPSLEALKLLIGHAASHIDGGAHIMLSDVRRTYLHALAKQDLCVLNCPLRMLVTRTDVLDGCDLLVMVLVMRRRSGKSVCRITL